MTKKAATPIPVKDIKRGDEFVNGDDVIWTAIGNAELYPAEEPSDYGPQWCRLSVRYADGGDGQRTWDDPNIPLTIRRAR